MKYGILSYERKKLSLNGRDTQNMGDWVQTIAMVKPTVKGIAKANTKSYDF